jgi:hypothetical protein
VKPRSGAHADPGNNLFRAAATMPRALRAGASRDPDTIQPPPSQDLDPETEGARFERQPLGPPDEETGE